MTRRSAMHPFRNLPIKWKLSIITMVTSGVALLLAGLVWGWLERSAFHHRMVRDLTIMATLTGLNSEAGMKANDRQAVEHVLGSLAAHPRVRLACIYGKDERPFAQYRRSDVGLSRPPARVSLHKFRFGPNELELVQDIRHGGQRIGTVYIASDLEEGRTNLERVVVGIVALVAVCSLVAFLIAARLHRTISEPLAHLQQTVAAVASSKDYSLRVVKCADDELGMLIGGFNAMLDTIQERDQALQQENLERQRAEETLARERDLLRTLMDTSPDFIYFKDRQSRFIRCSRTVIERFGQTGLDDVLGKTDFDFFAEDHARPAFQDEQSVIQSGQPLIGKVEREVWKTGRECWALTTKVPLRDANGEIIGTFGISKDITAIKEAEAKLEEVHKELVLASRLAGMAEVATGVLHNVGNVLNSINVSATVVSDRLHKSKAATLRRVVEALHEHESDLGPFLTQDPKGRQVPGLLTQLSDHLLEEQGLILQELDSLKRNIEHINDIVAMQQNYARVSGVTEKGKVVDLIEDALRMNSGALLRHDIRVRREYSSELPEITVDKHKVLQVLVNLVRNAKYACDESGRKDKQLILRASNGAGTIKIAVIDNGVGIPAENLTRIFNHGFTTRKNGHGFGLHSGALAAKELGGSLTVQSSGPGQGATFTLELPLQPSGNHS